jgi:hypothetical protein
MNEIWGYHRNLYEGLMTNFLDIIHYANSYFKCLWDVTFSLSSGKKPTLLGKSIDLAPIFRLMMSRKSITVLTYHHDEFLDLIY